MIDPVNSRCTILASVGSSGLTSSVIDGLPALGGQVRDQSVADLAAGAGNQDDWLTNHFDSPVTAGKYTLKLEPCPACW